MSRVFGAILGALVATGILANLALADATPIQLVLLYMPNVSTTGTSSASGIAELVMPEGEVRITAADLPHLAGDTHYAAWVINTETNEFQHIGAFNSVESTGAVHYENVLTDAIPNKHWNLLLVTVEVAAVPTKPSSKHSIAGVFPRADNEPLPGLLPNTGGDEPSAVSCQGYLCTGADWLYILGPAALTLTLGLAAGYGLGLKKR
jgi:hypothetical protein